MSNDKEKKKCPRKVCNYQWIARVKSPRVCPKCKQYINK